MRAARPAEEQPGRSPLLELLAGRLHGEHGIVQVRHRYDDVGGLRVHARWVAAGDHRSEPAIVLLHGIGMSSRYLVPLALRLARLRTVYAPDLPGHGLSAGHGNLTGESADGAAADATGRAALADTLIAWMDAVGIQQAVLVGTSYGCQLAVEVAVGHPGRVTQLVLASPIAEPRRRSIAQQLARWLADVRHEAPSLNLLTVREWLDARGHVLRDLRDAIETPIEQKLTQVHQPTLVLRGAADPIASEAWGRRVAELLAHGHLAVLDGAGHTVSYSAAAEVARAIRRFLEWEADTEHHDRRSPAAETT